MGWNSIALAAQTLDQHSTFLLYAPKLNVFSDMTVKTLDHKARLDQGHWVTVPQIIAQDIALANAFATHAQMDSIQTSHNAQVYMPQLAKISRSPLQTWLFAVHSKAVGIEIVHILNNTEYTKGYLRHEVLAALIRAIAKSMPESLNSNLIIEHSVIDSFKIIKAVKERLSGTNRPLIITLKIQLSEPT